jgi:hypothetical protein
MSRLITQNDITPETFIDLISNNNIIVYEDVQGSPIYVKYDGEKIIIKPRKLSNDPLNIIDLAIQKYYGPCFNFFTSLSENVKSLMPKNWWFEFEYFFDNEPAHIKYDKKPKNGLILTSIIKGKKRVWNVQEIEEYANLFEVDSLPIIFNGKLNDKQIEVIKYYLNTSPEDLKFIFDDSNFTHFFYSILNPNLNNSTLMNNGTFQDNVERIIIKIPNKKEEINIAILNPLYKIAEDEDEKTTFLETYSIILLNFLEQAQLIDLNDIELKSKSRNELYLELMSILYNYWLDNIEQSFENFEFSIPKFFKEEKFKVNLNNISNTETLKHIQNDEKKEYAFRSIVGSFLKQRKKPVGLFNQTSLKLFNDMVNKINTRIENELSIKRDEILRNKELMNFNDFAEVEYDEDAQGQVYPDIYSKAEEIGGEKKKKGKNLALIKKTDKEL